MASGDPRRGEGAQQEILVGENPVAYMESHMQAKTQERGNLQFSQGRSIQGVAANNSTGSLDFGLDMEAGGQADNAAEIGAS